MTTLNATSHPRQSSLRIAPSGGVPAEVLLSPLTDPVQGAVVAEPQYTGQSGEFTASATAYCRQARRLRARHRGNPLKLHRELAQLKGPLLGTEFAANANSDATEAAFAAAQRSRQLDAFAGSDNSEPRPSSLAPSPDSLTFAAHIEAALEGGMLCYARRVELLQEAARRGIGRFEANLMIAAVQHRANTAGRPAAAPPLAPTPVRRGTRDWATAIAGIVVVQAIILLGAWIMLR
jgi:hypothetical protein